MTVMVDELKGWPVRASSAQARRHFGDGKSSCHMTCDGDLDELHAFAKKIGLKRAWFQDHRVAPHYDLTPRRRAAAIAAGAIEVPLREQLIARREKKLVPRYVPPEPKSEEPKKKYELWQSNDPECGSYSFFPEDNESARKLLEPGATLVNVFEADSWDDARRQQNEFLRWEPYVPIAEEEAVYGADEAHTPHPASGHHDVCPRPASCSCDCAACCIASRAASEAGAPVPIVPDSWVESDRSDR